jgi:hypothetical protein
VNRFETGAGLPRGGRRVSLAVLRDVRGRLRRWLLPQDVLDIYESCEQLAGVRRLGDLATVSIGYVTGANDFFHLRLSAARRARIDRRYLAAAVRRGGSLPAGGSLTKAHVQGWIDADDAVLLLRIARDRRRLPAGVRQYLGSEAGLAARAAYKCRVRDPWWSVPDVTVPDGFLSVMSTDTPRIIRNAARCVATNSLHVVRMRNGEPFATMQRGFDSTLTRLSCELEGHPLGGGLLKIEPREAQRVLVPQPAAAPALRRAQAQLEQGITLMRAWRGNVR